MISSAENDELELAEELPVAPYEAGDELDCESCSACRNCCRMLLAELVPDELVLLVEDELADDDEAPWPPWPP